METGIIVFLLVNFTGLLGGIAAIVAVIRASFYKGFLIQVCSTLLMFVMVGSVYLTSGYGIAASAVSSARYTILYVLACVVLCMSALVARMFFVFITSTTLMLLRTIVGPIDDFLCFAWMAFTNKSPNAQPAEAIQAQNSPSGIAGGRWKRDVRLFLEALVIWHTPAITKWLVGTLPSTNVITNVLDLISLVLATPKLFTKQMKDFLFERRFKILKLFAAILVPYVSFRVSLYTAAPMLSIFTDFEKLSPFPLKDHMMGYMGSETKEVQDFAVWTSGFALSITAVSLIFLVCVIVLNYKLSQGDEEKLADRALMFSLIVFSYSRAISMLA